MHRGRHQCAAKQQNAQEGRLEKECGQPLIGQQRRYDVAGGVGKPAPVGAKLKRHHDPGDHTHAEGNGEDAQPETRQAGKDRTPGKSVGAFQKRDKGCQPDRKGRQQDVPADHPGKLEARQQHRINLHRWLSPTVALHNTSTKKRNRTSPRPVTWLLSTCSAHSGTARGRAHDKAGPPAAKLPAPHPRVIATRCSPYPRSRHTGTLKQMSSLLGSGLQGWQPPSPRTTSAHRSSSWKKPPRARRAAIP